MNFDFAMSTTISADVIKEIITKAVEEYTNRTVTEVVFRTINDYNDERGNNITFNGCTVMFAQVEPKPVVPNLKKKCNHKINGACQLHNLQCSFPQCEK